MLLSRFERWNHGGVREVRWSVQFTQHEERARRRIWHRILAPSTLMQGRTKIDGEDGGNNPRDNADRTTRHMGCTWSRIKCFDRHIWADRHTDLTDRHHGASPWSDEGSTVPRLDRSPEGCQPFGRMSVHVPKIDPIFVNNKNKTIEYMCVHARNSENIFAKVYNSYLQDNRLNRFIIIINFYYNYYNLYSFIFFQTFL